MSEKENPAGAPAETRQGGFGGERRDSGAVRRQSRPRPKRAEGPPTAVELSPQAEASERSLSNGAPAETRQSGFGGERRDSGVVELSPQAEASERSLSRHVSRETPETTPEQAMLNEIMDRAMAGSQPGPEEDAGQEVPPQEEAHVPEGEAPPPSPPEKNKPSSVYIYLVVLFGAAFLMLLLAYFVQKRNNAAAMNDLRISSTASREELLADIKGLEEERDQLQKEVEYQKDRAAQIKEERDNFEMSMDIANRYRSDARMQSMTLTYFWYITQFMEHKDYPMAAAAILFSADFYRYAWHNGQISINPAQLDQYEAYRQELIDKGYLQQLDHARDGGTDIWFAEKWNPGDRDDVAALCILWLSLDKHFVEEYDNGASQYLYLYPLGDPSTGYQEQVERLASKFTLEQFQLLKDELVENKWLAIAEDGTMSEGFGPTDSIKTDELYTLPFRLPTTPTQAD